MKTEWNKANVIPRQQYMNGTVTHEQYYGQFVTPGVAMVVGSRIGLDNINASIDPHFNDIPLAYWDALHNTLKEMVGLKIGYANGDVVQVDPHTKRYSLSLSDTVCVAKEAARQLRNAAVLS